MCEAAEEEVSILAAIYCGQGEFQLLQQSGECHSKHNNPPASVVTDLILFMEMGTIHCIFIHLGHIGPNKNKK